VAGGMFSLIHSTECVREFLLTDLGRQWVLRERRAAS
jgi:hypothetical protein